MRFAKNKMYLGWLLIVTMLLMLFACNEGGSSTVRASNLKAITAFSFPSVNGSINGTIIGQNIAVTMPFGTNVTDLIATFTTTGASVSVNGVRQVSGITPNNFTNHVKYIVTAADGTTSTYTVTVTVAASYHKAITAFSFPSVNGPINATIIGQNITLTMPYGTNVTDLIATFTTTGTSVLVNGVRQVSGTTPNNFTSPIAYIVTAADGTTSTYTVTVTVAASYLKAITAFSLNGTPGTIIGQNIAVTMPYGTNVTDLIATFTTTGASVSVNGVPQVSGTTPNNFTSPIAYIVTAADGTTRNYTVTVTVAESYLKAITAFSLNGTPGTIIGQNIAVTMPFGTNVTDLIAAFTTTGASVSVNGVPQVSGTTPNNFTSPVAYIVTAADGTTATYTVTVTVAESYHKAITAYSLNGTAGTINGQNIAVTMPFGTNVTDLIATFTTTGTSVSVNGVPQVSGTTPNNFTSPVAYTVTAADGTTRNYTVTVTVAESYHKAITAFSLNGTPGTIIGQNISVTMPFGTNVTDLIATFTTTGASVSVNGVPQVSGTTPNNFTSPVAYTVTAADGTTRNYTVTVKVAANDNKAITAFSLNVTPGIIVGHYIVVTMPFGTNVTDLIATFTTTGASVSVNGVPQVSGTTPNNFTNPVEYIVTAADGSTTTYTVTVTVAASYHKAITAFSLNGTPGTIIGQSIAVTMPFATNVTDLIATFTTTGASVSVNGVPQVSGTTPNNFINPVSYIVTAADGTTATYKVTVTVATPFVAYYPSGCTLNNAAAGITGSCTCIKDTDTGNIWTTAGDTEDTWINWCNHTPGTPGYDPNCPTTSNKLDTWNNSAQCGLTGGWRLPTAPTPSMNPSNPGQPSVPLSGTNPGGDWSDLYNIAISGSAPPGTAYISGGDLSIWMNNNGFMNISNDIHCIDSPVTMTCPGYYWSSGLTLNTFGWEVFMNNGSIPQQIVVTTTGVLLVHSGQ